MPALCNNSFFSVCHRCDELVMTREDDASLWNLKPVFRVVGVSQMLAITQRRSVTRSEGYGPLCHRSADPSFQATSGRWMAALSWRSITRTPSFDPSFDHFSCGILHLQTNEISPQSIMMTLTEVFFEIEFDGSSAAAFRHTLR